MDANQLFDGIARAVEVAKPAQEYCLFGINWWATCMTKAEWSGWMQAIFSVVAIAVAMSVAWWQRHHEVRHESKAKTVMAAVTASAIGPQLRTLVSSCSEFLKVDEADAEAIRRNVTFFRHIVARISYPTEEQILRLVPIDHAVAADLLDAIDSIKRSVHVLEVGFETHPCEDDADCIATFERVKPIVSAAMKTLAEVNEALRSMTVND